ncbi:phosphonate ABC transporter ATP-binding protein [Lampropedia aestuarii]|uniref:phosphonate ABC transporter ATP-binding protein n=1 Tax=Lampropedia aestuarii TaxID=2562762 RepID=UPI00246949E7|nr:ATP-binding cassette domain-containing protein [Lampropedia aestuarii]MDH5855918.1 ATP-binding cassette domain-containing protein [Lampropedia aestuarii]
MGFSLQGLGVTHANGFVALSGIKLQARQGDSIALIGPSGAGKTTLLNVIGTAQVPTSGRVQVLDQLVDTGMPAAALRRLRARIGFVYQAPPIPPRQRVVTAVLAGKLGQWPAWKSVVSLLYPQDAAGAQQALARVHLGDKLFVHCDQLSGGQLQRVAIARVLYQEAQLIVADEPVSALDPILALDTVELLVKEAKARNATLVASLHTVELARRCFERLIGIRAGRIVFDLPANAVSEQQLQALYATEPLEGHVQAPLAQAAASPPSPSLAEAEVPFSQGCR